MMGLEENGPALLVGLGLIYLLTKFVRFAIECSRPKNYPPGPPAQPILGNLLDIPLKKPFLAFQSLAAKYGKVVGLKAGPTNLIILDNPSIIRELFEKRGMKYSDRPYNYIANEHIVPAEKGQSLHIIFMNRGENWRRWRSAVRQLLGPKGCEQVLPIQGAVATRLARDILIDPDRHLDHIRRWGLVTPFVSICGRRDIDDETVRDFYETQHLWLDLLEPGKTPPVDAVPFLRWVPRSLAKWKRDAAFVRDSQRAFYDALLSSARKQIAAQVVATPGAPTKYECLMARILKDDKAGEWSDQKLAYLGGGLLDAAIDTTAATFQTLVLAIAAHPEVQLRAQEELDRVCGNTPPQVEALEQLSYLRACLMETLRWRPATPMTLPHCLSEDDTFNGLYFPKGATVLQNTWAIHHNEAYFDRPHFFDPSRYLQTPSGMRPEAVNSDPETLRRPTWVFGVGRRACPGDRFALQGILITAAKLLWAFNVIAEEPLETSIEKGFCAGLVSQPENFKVKYSPRSDSKRRAVLDDHRSAELFLDEML